MTTYALNGLGRIGKLALRPLLERGAKIAFINDAVGDPAMHAHLLEFDSIHGRWPATFEAGEGAISIDGTRIPVTNTLNLEDLPLDGVDVMIDCTGAFKTEGKLAPYFAAGVKKVIVSAPVKDGPTANIVYGVNEDIYEADTHQIVTAASCTTNCLAPVVKVLLEGIGIKHGSITTIHDVTNTQTIVDRPAKDLRRARSALTNLIPTTTGSATAITLIYPELKGKLNGHAVRVPLLNASITDCVFEMARETTVDEVNSLFKAAAEGPLKGILGYETRPLVSSDYTNDQRSGIIDAPSTMVVNGTQLKVYAWYDNEMGYAHRLVDVALMVGGKL
ncbi:ArsJ-associated glyceraldehyde-3-phosphate dehydrogenase [Sulfitobacter pseudonitzschiae]|uniref:Glyceraldehyde-3-phosphate dehydrogenase n=1 Tax=Pseudosulfitobacter pseudonitzschiae TaxID=1402135 RepID=A0A073J8P5_9RHOB|nr:ArsJ-associated glyceraldehyde-3-phosphate dehydrogenase [Pseudosulfitobacter pseudonitzschiae]KEJ94087.1 glyceraldehyde-3-phosphate dehydrogenase [Pseudosulfitobacter pseudonitzschiae]MBM2294880.1 ArsJ-associated glyceraldehyde-3-phosphate dehydrogenase [Pseudosulfitobacter pseudonitzschiae]MBM2299796.1 ArsJ-associated glyceraldehyde-3-phosphate dehydrogenase [Pseudosulfitobacter pseudonitzschiae]MBM2304717.1 ArsJ-associated glyceraldehyde-3-phosphate dehydrogenase [Pseudosulfitobacter pseu|tara:strand:- start:1150 stop:2148 length:999 start_codon:yes stop_codon:yes gene_type:complete